MKFYITPLTGIDEITFGMSLNEVRDGFKSPCHSFKRTPAAAHPCDYYESLGLFVYYDASSNVEAIEFSEPAQLYFQGNNLMTTSFKDIINLLKSVDINLEKDSDSFMSYSLGIGGYSPEASEKSKRTCESIILFKDGYYR